MNPVNPMCKPVAFTTPVGVQFMKSRPLSLSCLRRAHRPTVASASPPQTASSEPNSYNLSRRSFVALLASVPILPFLPLPSRADGLLSQLSLYRDLPKGFLIFRPNGWNEFEGLQDNYDIKWQDVIQPLEFITVLTDPVGKDKKLANIGDVQTVGSKLASSRSGELVAAEEKDIDGIPAYVFEIKRENTRQITLLCINKMKLYSVNTSCPEKRWGKREKLLRAVVDSFKPKL